MAELLVGNDHVVVLKELRDDNGNFISGATVEATLFLADGVTAATGASWPVSLPYTGTKGTYSQAIPTGVVLQDNKRYVLKVTATYVGRKFEQELVLRASKNREMGTVGI